MTRNELIRPGKSARREKAFYDIAEILAPAILCVLLLFTFALRPMGVDGISMEPTLEDGQKLIFTAIPAEPARGDIVVISPRINDHHKPLVKRVIAVAGDEIDFADGRVLINGKALEEPYLPEGLETFPASKFQSSMVYPARVPDGRVFVMGDNRGVSSDSRSNMVGFVRVDDILGKVIIFG